MAELCAESRPTAGALKGLECKIASSLAEWHAAFALVYQSYHDAGLADYVPSGVRVTPFQVLPSTSTLIARHEGIVLGSLSLVLDSTLGVPMESAYPAQIANLRNSPVRFAEISSLATAKLGASEFRDVFTRLMRFVAQHARHVGIGRLLITTHPRHMPFYERLMGFKRCGGFTKHPSVRDAPAVAAMLDFDELDQNPPPFYHECFDVGIQSQALLPKPMPREIANYFLSLVEENERSPAHESSWKVPMTRHESAFAVN
ncbi:MAG TPA: hypothetical protein VM510_03105 [Caulifigura sp.]|nr:hypothetical protein [Caulifigura sp.]